VPSEARLARLKTIPLSVRKKAHGIISFPYDRRIFRLGISIENEPQAKFLEVALMKRGLVSSLDSATEKSG